MDSIRAEVPARAVVYSLASLMVPIVGTLMLSDVATDFEILLWLLAIVPAFLLAYYRGWRGVAAALAAGMVALAFTQAATTFTGTPIANWPVLLGVVAAYIAISLGIGHFSELLHRARAKVRELTLTDEDTALPNRRSARMFLEREFAAARRGRDLTVVLFDTDELERCANGRGPKAADKRTQQLFGDVLRERTRGMNLSARYDDGAFLSVLSAGEVDGTLVFVDRVRTALEEAADPAAETATVRVGVASYHGGMRSPDDLLRAAKFALDRARREGRDDVGVFEPGSNRTSEVQRYLTRAREHLRSAGERGPERN